MEESGTHPGDTEFVEIEFDLTMEDYLSSIAEASLVPEHLPAVRRYRRQLLRQSLMAIGCGAVLVALFLYFQVRAREPEIWVVFVGGIMICLAGAFASILPMRAAQRRYAHWHVQHAASRMDARQFGRRILRVDANSITVIESQTTWTTSWAAVAGFGSTARFVYLRLDDGTGPILPRSAISDATLIRLQELCEQHATGERALTERITALLAERDLNCPACSYPCRGVTTARCPECGRRIWQTDLHPTNQTATSIADEAVARTRKKL